MWLVLAEQSGSSPLAWPLAPQIALPLIAIALGLGYGLYRLSRVDLLARFRPYILVGILGLWGLAAIETIFAIAHALTPSWLSVSLFLLTLIAVTNYQWMRNVMAGLTLAFEDRLDLGDSIRIGDYEGTIRDFGLRSVEVRGTDGRLYEIPNYKFVEESFSNYARGGDSACDIVMQVPDAVTVEEARTAGREAALVSPLASPHREPEVYIEAGESDDGAPTLRVRGYVFDPTHRERFESDVTNRLLSKIGGDSVPTDGAGSQ